MLRMRLRLRFVCMLDLLVIASDQVALRDVRYRNLQLREASEGY